MRSVLPATFRKRGGQEHGSVSFAHGLSPSVLGLAKRGFSGETVSNGGVVELPVVRKSLSG